MDNCSPIRASKFLFVAIPLLTIHVLMVCTSAEAQTAPAMACESLAGRELEGVKITSAAKVPAAHGNPANCKVLATQDGTEHDIEALLPDSWSGRLYQQGGGGFDGQILELLSPAHAAAPGSIALAAGAIVLANNGGYRDPTGAKLLNNPAATQLYAHTAIHVVKQFGNALAVAYYGSAPKYSYYVGCSNGGRGAANAASKYGDEYDGVVSGAPGLNMVGLVEGWTRAATLDLPEPAKLKAVNAAVVAKCDVLDGAKDGVISNWEACKFDPEVDAPAAGLTSSQAASVKALMTDLKLKDGTTIYSGLGFGDMSPWARAYAMFGTGHMRNIILSDPNWSPAGFDVDASFPAISGVMRTKYGFNPEPEGIVSFLQSGKKMIVWHGSDDSLISHRDTIRVFQGILKTAGPKGAENSRLYIASGVNHCGGGPGADDFDLLTPLMKWVEKGQAPSLVVASKFDRPGGKLLFTRPVCTYPSFPRYKGTGDMNDAASFACATK